MVDTKDRFDNMQCWVVCSKVVKRRCLSLALRLGIRKRKRPGNKCPRIARLTNGSALWHPHVLSRHPSTFSCYCEVELRFFDLWRWYIVQRSRLPRLLRYNRISLQPWWSSIHLHTSCAFVQLAPAAYAVHLCLLIAMRLKLKLPWTTRFPPNEPPTW